MRFVLPVIIFALLASSAHALLKLPDPLPAVADNPADKLRGRALEVVPPTTPRRPSAPRTTSAAASVHRSSTGMGRSYSFLGVSWGTYRCERWEKGQASLHAEGRALDWHLDAADPSARRAPTERLVRLLLAPARRRRAAGARPPHGRPGADLGLRLLGGPGDDAPSEPYSACYTKRGQVAQEASTRRSRTATTSTSG